MVSLNFILPIRRSGGDEELRCQIPDQATPPGNGSAALSEHFPRIENSIGIQNPPQFPHHPHLRISGELWQKRLLRYAHTVFSGNCAPQPNRLLENLFECLLNPCHFFFIALVSEKRRVQVSIAHMAESANLQTVLF